MQTIYRAIGQEHGKGFVIQSVGCATEDEVRAVHRVTDAVNNAAVSLRGEAGDGARQPIEDGGRQLVAEWARPAPELKEIRGQRESVRWAERRDGGLIGTPFVAAVAQGID